MTGDALEEHNRLTVDQFTRMAKKFADMPAHSDEQAMQMLFKVAAVSKGDRVLDVCCGTGIVACAFAPEARDVTGIDLTPAMIEQAKQLQQRKRLKNVSWQVGNVAALPFADDTFSIVVCRYAFHHLLDPIKVLSEMVRVCRLGGRLVVADVFAQSVKQGVAYDRVEKLRDPSHVRALPLDEIAAMFRAAALRIIDTKFYRLAVGLEPCLQASATNSEAAEEVRRLLIADIGKDETGMSPLRINDSVAFSFPVVVAAGRR